MKDQKMMKFFQKEIWRMKTMHKILQKRGMILSCPKYLKTMLEMKVWALQEGNIISGLILIQTTQKTSDTKDWIFPEMGILFFYLCFQAPLRTSFE